MYRDMLASPIQRLPPELLALVFFVYAKENRELDDLRWTKLLLVCKRWHAVGMQTHKLWSFIDLSPHPMSSRARAEVWDKRDLRRIELQRARAGNALLNVRMHLIPSLAAAKLNCIPNLWKPESLRALDVFGVPKSISKVLEIVGSREHAALVHLTVGSWTHGRFGDEARALSLDDILRSNAPNLQSLLVTCIQFDWTFIRNLHSLSVSYRGSGHVTITAQGVLDALSRCPSLERFTLLLPYNLQLAAVSHTAVVLPCMSELAVVGNAELCHGLLKAITGIPSTAKLRVSITDPLEASDITQTRVLSMVSYVGSHASRRNAPTLRSLAVGLELSTLGYEPPAWILVFRGQHHLRRDWIWEDHRFTRNEDYCSLAITIASITVVEDAANILRSWPLANVERLDARLFETLKPIHWRALLANLPSVTTIILGPESQSAESLLEVLRADLRQHGRRVVATVIFDARNSLRGYAQDENEVLCLQGGGAIARRNVMRLLSYCAEAARAGVPLNTVEIIGDPEGSEHRMLEGEEEEEGRDWRELYKDLKEGFVYEGVLYNATSGPRGVEHNSFEGW
ncbi:hypothetical protein PENSPDRAFT_647090 [Peniophora sp. CONT]|nr:hypothetical protein PENSPDRAFT_647090 [Peniophora sp. CONT]